jgi:hypothetical protein
MKIVSMPISRQISRHNCSRRECNKPVYVEVNGFTHPYCGRTCASYVLNNSLLISRCKNPTCLRQKYLDLSGIQYDYCGKSCARQHLNRETLYCSRSNCPRRVYTSSRNGKTNFHSYCSSNCYWLECSTLSNTKLSLLDNNDLDYIWARQRFISMLPKAKIKGIIRLQMQKSLIEAHQNLKRQIATRSGLSLKAITHKMFHGTTTNCDPLRYIQRLSPTCSSGCGLCGIVSRGNDIACSNYSGQMWFANDPSISYSYCRGSKPTKVIFMVDVLSKKANDILIVNQNAVSYNEPF